ncbi:MAG: acyl-CoA dehydrogenase family protein [Deltaproteobacteria bacterium]|nr:acyl-CoA dehydrogenase family protein [Deltaproteobacteria bacterium]
MTIDFELTDAQIKLREETKQFTDARIRPLVDEMERKKEFNKELASEITSNVSSYWIPKEYGGKGAESVVDLCLIAEEIGAAYGSCLTIFEVGGLASVPIVKGGTEEQRHRFLEPFCRGEYFFAFGLTDGGGPGSNPVESIRTTAVKDGDNWVINGRKRLISNVDLATHVLVFAYTDRSKGAKGISAFLVPIGTKGFNITEKQHGHGLNAHDVEILDFENCILPNEYLIGEEGMGFIYSMKGLDKTRLCLAAGVIGIAREALKIGVDFAKNRIIFGESLTTKQAMTYPLIELSTRIEAGRLLAWRAAKLEDKGVRHSAETSQAKWFCAETAVDTVYRVIRMMSGNAWSNDQLHAMLHDAITFTNAQGSAEIHKLIMSRFLFEKN